MSKRELVEVLARSFKSWRLGAAKRVVSGVLKWGIPRNLGEWIGLNVKRRMSG